jgi:hypothetical protein
MEIPSSRGQGYSANRSIGTSHCCLVANPVNSSSSFCWKALVYREDWETAMLTEAQEWMSHCHLEVYPIASTTDLFWGDPDNTANSLILHIYCHMYEVIIDGVGSVIRFIELRSVTKRSYNCFTNSHTLQCTRAHTDVFSACCVFTSLLIMASNGRCSPSSGFLNCPWPQLPASHSNS